MTTQVPLDEVRSLALRVAAWSEVRDVRLFKVTSQLNGLPDQAETLSYGLSSDVSVQYLEEDVGIIVTGEYEVTIREGTVESSEDEEDQNVVLELSFTMAALFGVTVPEGAEVLRPAELDAFAKTTGQFALHPYAREFVADLTGRMGLPQLHIGMLKLHLDGPNDTDSSRVSSGVPTAATAAVGQG